MLDPAQNITCGVVGVSRGVGRLLSVAVEVGYETDVMTMCGILYLACSPSSARESVIGESIFTPQSILCLISFLNRTWGGHSYSVSN